MGHSDVGISDPNVPGVHAKVLTDAEADTGQAALAVRVISQNGGGGGGGNTVQIEGADGSTLLPIQAVDTLATSDNGIAVADPLLAAILQGGIQVDQGSAGTSNTGWFIEFAQATATSGTFTNSTQTTSVTAVSIQGFESITVSIHGTYGTATAVFEGSDDAGTTWYALPLARSDSPVVEFGYTGLSNVVRMWTGQITGLNQFRVRSTAVASGTANIRISPSAAPTADAAVSQTLVTNGTNTVDVVAGDTGNNAIIVGSARKEVSFSTTTAQAVASTDASNYSYVSVHIVTQGGSSTVNFQCSNDNTNWVAVGLQNSNNNNSGTSAATTGVLFSGEVWGRYFRLNVTGIVSGTTAGTVEFFSISRNSAVVAAIQSGTWSVGATLGQAAAAMTDALANPTVTQVGGANELFNGTTWDRQRGNITGNLIAVGTTSTQSAVALTTYNARGLLLQIQIASGTGTLTVAINGVTTNFSYNILTSAALTSGGNQLRVFPGAVAASTLVANDIVPRSVTVTATVVGTMSYGIDYVLTV